MTLLHRFADGVATGRPRSPGAPGPRRPRPHGRLRGWHVPERRRRRDPRRATHPESCAATTAAPGSRSQQACQPLAGVGVTQRQVGVDSPWDLLRLTGHGTSGRRRVAPGTDRGASLHGRGAGYDSLPDTRPARVAVRAPRPRGRRAAGGARRRRLQAAGDPRRVRLQAAGGNIIARGLHAMGPPRQPAAATPRNRGREGWPSCDAPRSRSAGGCGSSS